MALAGQIIFTPVQAMASTTGIGSDSYWALGANYAWNSWGNDFNDNGWTDRFNSIKSQFDDMASKGVHSVRWWVFCDMWAAPLFSSSGESGLCTGLPNKWIDHMIEATNYAKSKNMKIYYTFTSFDVARNGNAWDHDSVLKDPVVRKSFIDNAVKPIVQELGTNDGVMGWDVVNEPEWMIAKADNGEPNSELETFSLSTVRSFVKDMVDCIHTYAKQPVSVGSASMKWCKGQYDFWSGLGLDFYDFHWYDWATPWFNPLKTSPADLKLDKPVIIGEMMPDTVNSSLKMTHQQVLEGILKNGYSGYMLWAWTDDKINCVNKTSPDFANFVAAHPELNIVSAAKKGDLNDDGAVNSIDSALMKRRIINTETKVNTNNADMNNDGVVNSIDAALLKRLILGIK